MSLNSNSVLGSERGCFNQAADRARASRPWAGTSRTNFSDAAFGYSFYHDINTTMPQLLYPSSIIILFQLFQLVARPDLCACNPYDNFTSFNSYTAYNNTGWGHSDTHLVAPRVLRSRGRAAVCIWSSFELDCRLGRNCSLHILLALNSDRPRRSWTTTTTRAAH